MENNYKEYLDSFAWKAIKQVKLSEQPECECCGESATTVHHLSYERRGSERAEDIVSICERCHHECHFVNGYQIKNDEETLRKRFEEVRLDKYGEKSNYCIQSDEIYYKGDRFYKIANINIKFTFGTGSNSYSETFIGIYRYCNKIYGLVDYYSSDNRSEGNYYNNIDNIDNDGTWQAEFEGYDQFIGDEGDEGIHEATNIIGKKEIYNDIDGDQYICGGYIIYELDLDSDSLIILNKKYIKDKNGIYYNLRKITTIDSKTFEILHDELIRDRNGIYYKNGEKIDFVDGDSFVIINEFYCKDKNHVYKIYDFDISIIEGVSAKTFQILNKYYYRDEKTIFFNDLIMDVNDPLTFKVIDGKYAKDNFNVYYENKIIENADTNSFEVIDSKHSKDKNYVYIEHEKLIITATSYNRRTEERIIRELGSPDPAFFSKNDIDNDYKNCVYKKS